MPDADLTVHLFEDVELEGATIIDGFPSVGLVSTITANYLIDALDLTQIGIMDSTAFPTVSIVRGGVPLYPVRIYAGQGVVVFISEFQPAPKLIRPIADAILDFARDHEVARIVSPEGLVIDSDEAPGEEPDEVAVYGLASQEATRGVLEEQGLEEFSNGIITGVSGVLLNLGKKHGFDTVSLLAEANPNFPDARAAAKVIEHIDKLLPDVEVDVKPLYTEAENIEQTLRRMQKQAQGAERPDRSQDIPPMYG